MWDHFYKTLRPLFQAPDQLLKHIDPHTTVLDLGCGYGDLCALICTHKHPQAVTGIDHDSHKIQIARTQYAHHPNLQFDVADLQTHHAVTQHTVLIIDVLHYFDKTTQIACLQNLSENPCVHKIVVRDALRSPHPGYLITRLHEFFMTRIKRTRVHSTKFAFFTRSEWQQIAHTLNWPLTLEKAGLPVYNDHLLVFTRSSQNKEPL